MEAYGKRIDAKTVWDVVRKSDGRSGEDIRLCACFGAVEDENGASITQELANIRRKEQKPLLILNINADGSYCVGSDIRLSDGIMIVVEPKEDK